MRTLYIFFAVLFCMLSCNGRQKDGTIPVGGIFDLTGATHETSVPYADGIRNYITHINAQGGINGRKIRLIEMDSRYIVPRAKIAYETLVNDEKVCAILGWGTGETEHLRPFTARDKVPFMSASLSQNLTGIHDAPYNFLIGVTYSDQMKLVLKHVLDRHKTRKTRPRVAFIYNETEFGRSPIPAGREFAAANGIDIVAEEIVSLDAREAKAPLERIRLAKADYAVIQETTWAASVILNDARRMNMTTEFIGLNWCADEKLIALSGSSAEGFVGTMPFVFTDESLPGIREIMDYNRSSGINIEGYILRYVQGWATAKVLVEGIRRAGSDLSGPSIRRSLESISGFDTGGITAPVTFTPTSHKGCSRLKLGRVVSGKWTVITDYLSAD